MGNVSFNNIFAFQDAVENHKYVYQKGDELIAVKKNHYLERFICWIHGYSRHDLGKILSTLEKVLATPGYLQKLNTSCFAQLHNDIVGFRERVRKSKFYNATAIKPLNALSQLFQDESKRRKKTPVPKKMPLTKAEAETLSSGLQAATPKALPSQPKLAQPTVASSDPEARVDQVERSNRREDTVLDEGYSIDINAAYGTERRVDVDSESEKQNASWIASGKTSYDEAMAGKDYASNPVRKKEDRSAFEACTRPIEERGAVFPGPDFSVRTIEVDETNQRFVPNGVQIEETVEIIHSHNPELSSGQTFDDVVIHDRYFPPSAPSKASRVTPAPDAASSLSKKSSSKNASAAQKHQPTRGKRILPPMGKLHVEGQSSRILANHSIIENFDSNTAGRKS